MMSNSLQVGENGSLEYAWSQENIEEKIVQFYFQSVRTDVEETIVKLEQKLEEILGYIKNNLKSNMKYFHVMLRMILQTRDIVKGKGEYKLAYMMLFTFYKYFPKLSLQVLETFVLEKQEPSQIGDNSDVCKQPYGSWKDMKYFAEYCREKTWDENHPFIKKCIELINNQIQIDEKQLSSEQNISLCAKWVPREGSKYSWLFKLLACDYYKYILPESKSAKNKSYTNYRKLISALNRKLDTVQIKQCSNTWENIDHNKTTSMTLNRNRNAFLNINKDKSQRYDKKDRIVCAEKFKKYIEERVKNKREIKGKNVGLNSFTHDALELINKYAVDSIEAQLLNAQWISNSAQNKKLGKMVAMVDTSGSMDGKPLEVAIALGIRIAEKSILGKNVLTFSETPTWHDLSECDNFVSMVDTLRNASWSMNTNFKKALELILDRLIAQKIPPEEASDMVLAIFSDMQIDSADPKSSSMIELIEDMYRNCGYTCPHILFWNLRSTTGFPTLSSKHGSSMMSGFSPVLLNEFCENGVDALKTTTPWNTLYKTLHNDRYTINVEYVISVD